MEASKTNQLSADIQSHFQANFLYMAWEQDKIHLLSSYMYCEGEEQQSPESNKFNFIEASVQVVAFGP